jgi:hypothetical protein
MKNPADPGEETEAKNPPDAPTADYESSSVERGMEMDAFREALIEGVQKMRGAGLVNLLDE